MYYILLWFTMLYYTVLYYDQIYYTILYSAIHYMSLHLQKIFEDVTLTGDVTFTLGKILDLTSICIIFYFALLYYTIPSSTMI